MSEPIIDRAWVERILDNGLEMRRTGTLLGFKKEHQAHGLIALCQSWLELEARVREAEDDLDDLMQSLP